MTKLHGLETFFYGTPVVVLPRGVNQFALDSNSICPNESYLIDTINVRLDKLTFKKRPFRDRHQG